MCIAVNHSVYPTVDLVLHFYGVLDNIEESLADLASNVDYGVAAVEQRFTYLLEAYDALELHLEEDKNQDFVGKIKDCDHVWEVGVRVRGCIQYNGTK